MTSTINKTWRLFVGIAQGADVERKYFEVKEESKELYAKEFRRLYNQLRDNYMEKKNEPLDRHKVASIIMISIVKADALRCLVTELEGKVFFALYEAAVATGLSYMQYEFNCILLKNQKNKINQYLLPEAFSCSTSYRDILARNLYYANMSGEWGMNPLDLSEKMFLLECLTIKELDIDAQIFKK